MSSSELFYTNQRLNAEWEDAFAPAVLMQYNTMTGALPLNRLSFTGLPPAVGAYTLPPMGNTSSPVDVSGADYPTVPTSRVPLFAAAALVASYLMFLPM